MKTYLFNVHEDVLYKSDKELTAKTLLEAEAECLEVFSTEELYWLWVIFEFEGILQTMYPLDSNTYRVKVLTDFSAINSRAVKKISESDFG